MPVGLIILLVLAGLGGLAWFSAWYSDYDRNRIDPQVTQAMLSHAPKGTRFPVTVWGGLRILEIGNANVQYRGLSPTTCVQVKVLDPTTGAEDPSVRYPGLTCIEGLAYRIR